jgi:DNA polymerase III delta prime subunit
MNKDSIPWIEKYRPTNFEEIVLDSKNREIFENIMNNNYFPNLLFYGPPGTGKTTTIINLINEYQTKHNKNVKGSVIHLNASDERGIDIIRNQIYSFVKTRNFFMDGLKFVILDEVDYMTKNAQQALKYLLQTVCTTDVRFCLICNYISKIETSLRNEFLCIRFNQLPKNEISSFVTNICKKENLQINDDMIDNIQNVYHSDIRSIVNFLQLNPNLTENDKCLITKNELATLFTFLKTKDTNDTIAYIQSLSLQYNIDKKNIVLYFFNYILRDLQLITSDICDFIEVIIHSQNGSIDYLKYFIIQMKTILRDTYR